MARDLNDVLKEQGEAGVLRVIDGARPYVPNGAGAKSSGDGNNNSELALAPVCAGRLLQRPAPPRRWLIHELIPANEVTYFGGDGGVGKSTVALQLAVACATSTEWLGKAVEPCKVLVLSAEDDLNEMHFRLAQIIEGVGELCREDLLAAMMDRLFLIDATRDLDPTLATYDDRNGIAPADLYNKLKGFIADHAIGLLIIDSAADTYAEEIKRYGVRSFMRLLKSFGCTVLLLAHPSRQGIETGSGFSGSTHWSNAARARFYLKRPENAEDFDVRFLEFPKANRAKAGLSLALRWQEGLFIVDNTASAKTIEQQLAEEALFLKLLQEFERTGQTVSPNRSCSFAPTVFEKHPEGKGTSKKSFERAMQVLLSAGKIEVVSKGKGQRETKILIVSKAAGPGWREASNHV